MGMGIEGSAIAVVIAQLVGAAFAVFLFIKERKKLSIKFTDQFLSGAIDKEILNEIFVGGFSTFVVEISDAIITAVLNNLLCNIGGDSAIIIIGIITKVSMFLYITVIGISSGMEPIAAYNLGAGNYRRVRDTLKVSIKAVIITSSVLWTIFMAFSHSIIGFFLKDNALLSETVYDFRIWVSMIPLIGIYYVIMYYYQAIGESKKSFLLSIYREMIIFIPLAVFLSRFYGMKGIVIAYPIADCIVVLTSAYSIRKALSEEFEEETGKYTVKRKVRYNVQMNQGQS